MGSEEDVRESEIMLLTLQSERGIWLKCQPRILTPPESQLCMKKSQGG